MTLYSTLCSFPVTININFMLNLILIDLLSGILGYQESINYTVYATSKTELFVCSHGNSEGSYIRMKTASIQHSSEFKGIRWYKIA